MSRHLDVVLHLPGEEESGDGFGGDGAGAQAEYCEQGCKLHCTLPLLAQR